MIYLKASFIKRILAFLIDSFILSIVFTVITINFNDNSDNISNKLMETLEQYQNNEITMEGDFSKTDTTERNKVTHVGRKLNLFYIDNSNNVINNYTLSVPKLVVKSNDTTIKGGKIKGDIYVESNGLILDDTKVEGNIYFKNEKNKDSFKLENAASVSGDLKVE